MHPVPPDWALKGAGTNRVQEDEDKHPDRKGKDINKDGNDVPSFLPSLLLYPDRKSKEIDKDVGQIISLHGISYHPFTNSTYPLVQYVLTNTINTHLSTMSTLLLICS